MILIFQLFSIPDNSGYISLLNLDIGYIDKCRCRCYAMRPAEDEGAHPALGIRLAVTGEATPAQLKQVVADGAEVRLKVGKDIDGSGGGKE